jgi:hypothetical protein
MVLFLFLIEFYFGFVRLRIISAETVLSGKGVFGTVFISFANLGAVLSLLFNLVSSSANVVSKYLSD